MEDTGFTPSFDDDETPFTQIPNRLLRDETLSAGAKLLYAILKSYAGSNLDQPCFPGQKTLARMTGFSEKTVRKYLDELEERGLLSLERLGHTKTNRYHLMPVSKLSISPPNVKLSAMAFLQHLQENAPRPLVTNYEFSWLCYGLSEANADRAKNFLENAPYEAAVNWLKAVGVPFPCVVSLLQYLGRGLPRYRRESVDAWLREVSPSQLKKFLSTFALDELPQVMPGYSEQEWTQILERGGIK